MTDDEKKAIIIAGSVAVIGLAIWLSKAQNLLPPGASAVQPTIAPGSGPGYTSYNVPPLNQPPQANIVPSAMNDNGNGCCNDGCFTAGGINTGNAPTSLTQLLNLYSVSNPQFGSSWQDLMKPFTSPQQSIIDMTNIPIAANSLY